jgi:hypothetical protein
MILECSIEFTHKLGLPLQLAKKDFRFSPYCETMGYTTIQPFMYVPGIANVILTRHVKVRLFDGKTPRPLILRPSKVNLVAKILALAFLKMIFF